MSNKYRDGDDENPVIREARDNFRRCEEWEGQARTLFRDDIRFANADSDNGYQWPNDIRKNRDQDERPCLTINKTAQHNNLITNEMKLNLPGIKFCATGNGATYEASQVWNGIARYIEYRSNATSIYGRAVDTQVEAGVGYWRVITDYVDDDSFDQDVVIKQIYDPLSVYLDPDAREADKSDMRFAFIYEKVAKDKFDKDYPEYKNKVGQNKIYGGSDWISKDYVIVCEYYKVTEEWDKLLRVTLDNGEQTQIFASELDAKTRKDFLARTDTVKRDVLRKKVKWYHIAGDIVIDEKDWIGTTIPIIQIVGKETIIEGIMDRKGHTRAMKDPQRIYNYWSSTAVEYGALQTKTPWVAPAQAIEGLETYWNSANRNNASVLPYNGLDDAGNTIAAPMRIEPPVSSPVALEGMRISSDELEAVSGQYAAQMGKLGNERSASTLAERQEQSDKATYHFKHNLAVGIRYTGKILLDIVPKIYDTERVVMIMGEDGMTQEVTIDPTLRKAFMEERTNDGEIAKKALNPKVGRYEVQADVGPGYATRREESFEAFKLILSQNPGLTSIIGDLLLTAGDFPMADEAAARLRRMIPPQAMGKGPTEGEQMAQQQLQQTTAVLKNVLDALAEERIKNKSNAAKRDVDAYRAVTDRISSLGGMKPEEWALTMDQINFLAKQLIVQSAQTDLEDTQAFTKSELSPELRQGELPLGMGGVGG